jgi:uncharacterized protein (TIGR03083 family)
MATRADVLARLAATRDEITSLVEGTPDAAWTRTTYDGWTCHDLLSHIASTSGPAGFILMIAKTGPPGGGGAAFDQDAFNKQQVAMRAERSAADILNEIRSSIQRDVRAVEAATDDLLAQNFTAPWGVSGTVAEVIIASHDGHLGMHIADLRAALPG